MPPQRQVQSATHVPVLRHQVLEQLALRPGMTVVDATLGAGGHSRDIIDRILPGGRLIGLDRDPMMLALAGERLQGCPVELVHATYAALPAELAQRGLSHVDRILADLGLSSDQLADASRGFSLRTEGPLDLRFDPSQGKPASRLLHELGEDELASIFSQYGEERYSREIAHAIVARRRAGSTFSALELANLITSVVPAGHRGRIHPATRVFQALRIAVNEELHHLSQLLDCVLPTSLVPGGRAVLISFHSLEDRMIKQSFRNSDVWELVTRKPITATPTEIRNNPRSRSAKLRTAIRK